MDAANDEEDDNSAHGPDGVALVRDVYLLKIGTSCHVGKIKTHEKTGNGEHKATVVWYSKDAPGNWDGVRAKAKYIENKEEDTAPVQSFDIQVDVFDWETYNPTPDKHLCIFYRMKRADREDPDDVKVHRCTLALVPSIWTANSLRLHQPSGHAFVPYNKSYVIGWKPWTFC